LVVVYKIYTSDFYSLMLQVVSQLTKYVIVQVLFILIKLQRLIEYVIFSAYYLLGISGGNIGQICMKQPGVRQDTNIPLTLLMFRVVWSYDTTFSVYH